MHCPILLCLVLFVTPLLAAKPAAASSTDVARFEKCQGPVSAWRENELIEGGSLAGFLEATREHQAWLDGKGYKVRVRTWNAFKPPVPPSAKRAGKQVAFGSELVYPSFDAFTKVMSTRQLDRNDRAYRAVLQKYKKNTTVKTHRLVCLSE